MSDYEQDLPEFDGAVPMFSAEAEMSVIGSMLLSERALADSLAVLEAKDFYRPAHRLIFGAIKSLADAGKAVDTLTLETELIERGNLGSIGGADYLLEISMYTPSASNSATYVKIVKEKEARRAAIEAGNQIIAAAQSNRPLQEIEQIGLGIASKMTLGRTARPDIDMRSLLRSQDSRSRPGSTKTGNAGLDSLMVYGGFTHGQITLSTAPTGGGKTTWALYSAFAAADRGERIAVLVFADNDEEDILERALRYKCGYPCFSAVAADYHEDLAGDKERRIRMFRVAQDEIDAWDWEVFNGVTNDEGGDFSTARAWLIRKHDEGLARDTRPKPIALAVWDYAQTIEVSDPSVVKRGFYDQQSWLAKKMAKLAANLNIPFIVCAQLTDVGNGKEVLAECKVWEKVCELYLRIHEGCIEIRKRRRGGWTNSRPGHRYNEMRWCHVPDGEDYNHALKRWPA